MDSVLKFNSLRQEVEGVLGLEYDNNDIELIERLVLEKGHLGNPMTSATPNKPLSTNLALLLNDELPFSETCESSNSDQYIPKSIPDNRKRIRTKFIKFKDSASTVGDDDLRHLFEAYDTEWFQGKIGKYFKRKEYTLDFITGSGDGFGIVGTCAGRCKYTITIPTRMFTSATQGTVVAGLSCSDSLDCLMRVLEHEMVHLIIFTFCENEYLSEQHSPLFTATTKKLFGHVNHTHQIGGAGAGASAPLRRTLEH
jgi:hypothetical protein